MSKKVMITGATDGIGLETARRLASQGHHLLIHGRSAEKLLQTQAALEAIAGAGPVERFRADLSQLPQVAQLGRAVRAAHGHLDVLINNAGVFKIDAPLTGSGHDRRFIVNTLAPALLTEALLPIFAPEGRAVHLSSAAQAPVDLAALAGQIQLGAMEAYAQSKLALTIWSHAFSAAHPDGPLSIAVNPGSMLATNMVREGFGVAGNDIGVGADVLIRAALSAEFAGASGRYYDNDAGQFAAPLGGDDQGGKAAELIRAIADLIAPYQG
ncbi:MAG: SDR family NAD(P)-dependent oxidoreductase [Sulfitobacter sp.]